MVLILDNQRVLAHKRAKVNHSFIISNGIKLGTNVACDDDLVFVRQTEEFPKKKRPLKIKKVQNL